MTFNKINILRNIGGVMILATLASCHSIFEDGENCPPRVKVTFVDNLNMSFTDRFTDEIKELQLLVFDESNTLVNVLTEQDSTKFTSDYFMPLEEVAPGKYSFIAWSGLNGNDPSFQLLAESLQTSVTTRQQVGAAIKELTRATAQVNHKMQQVWNGALDTQTITNNDTTVVVVLRHCVNDLQIILQRQDGAPLNVGDYALTLTGKNGEISYKSELQGVSEVAYLPYQTTSGKDSKGDYQRWDISTALLTTSEPMQLTVTDPNGTVLDMPFVPYALSVKSMYESHLGKTLTDDEFLMRQDSYKIKFVLDNTTGKWNNDGLYINDWRVVNENIKF